jgi:hypothetical protein
VSRRKVAAASVGRRVAAKAAAKAPRGRRVVDQEVKVGRSRPPKAAAKATAANKAVKATRAAPKQKAAKATTSKVSRGNVSVDNLLYKVEVIGRAPIFVKGMLVRYDETSLLMRHKRERSSKIIVESFSMKDVLFSNGAEGEQATVAVNVIAVIHTFEGRIEPLTNSDFIEVIMANGDSVVLNRNSSAGTEVKITAMEDDVAPEIKRKSSNEDADEEEFDDDEDDESEDEEGEDDESEDEEGEDDESEDEDGESVEGDDESEDEDDESEDEDDESEDDEDDESEDDEDDESEDEDDESEDEDDESEDEDDESEDEDDESEDEDDESEDDESEDDESEDEDEDDESEDDEEDEEDEEDEAPRKKSR